LPQPDVASLVVNVPAVPAPLVAEHAP
jgi:hypothetical protein